jgi:phosphotransferase system  glucose/maltose/N-acetylglucosamine-specific IIC component
MSRFGKIASSAPFRLIVGGLIAGLLGSAVYDGCIEFSSIGEVQNDPRQTALNIHENLMVLHFCFLGMCVALLVAVYNKNDFEDSGVKSFLGRVRRCFFMVILVLLELGLIFCVLSFIYAWIVDIRPPVYWDRVGGVVTDWFVDLLLLMLLMAVAGFNGVFIVTTLSGEKFPPVKSGAKPK